MRRKDKEIADRDAIGRILREALVCRLALCAGDRPYIVPMNFTVDGDALFLHSAPAGRKIELLRQNPNVCFEVEVGVEVVPAARPCDVGMRYRSVVGFGQASFVEDDDVKAAALQRFAEKYAPGFPSRPPPEAVRKVVVIRIAIEELHGKKSRC